MPETDLALLEAAALAAGEIAMKHFGRHGDVTEKPDGEGPVTAADIEIDRMLKAELTGARPGYCWLSEESPDDPARLRHERVFIVDPIDGTRTFIAGGREWGHALAVAEGGRVTAAVMHLPGLGRTYAAVLGRGACRDGAVLHVRDRSILHGAEMLVSAGHMRPIHWPGGVPEVMRTFRPSMVYRLCLVAEGRFDAAVNLRGVREWDAAAGTLIATEAGAAASDRRGGDLCFNQAVPEFPGLVVAGPDVHREIVARLAPH